MKNFITNSCSDDLKKRLAELISKSEELKFLVGFFYFSGIREFYESLKNKPDIKIKILVGLNVDKTNKGILELADENPKSSNQEKSHNFLRSIENSINSEEFDTKEFYEQAKFFIQVFSSFLFFCSLLILNN